MDIAGSDWNETDLGEQVRVVDGPYADQVGRVVELLESGDVVVLISILGEEQPITLGREQVARVD
jgi:transcription antitermination factor NusG